MHDYTYTSPEEALNDTIKGLNDYLEQRLAADRWRVGSGSPPESRRAGRLAVRRGLSVSRRPTAIPVI
jgi:hypothetical protein